MSGRRLRMRPREPGPVQAETPSLFRNPSFLALWSAAWVAQTTNTALQFVLLILVLEKTNSSIAGSGLIIALAAPPVVFGLISGVLVDRWDKRTVMLVANTLRAAFTALLIVADVSVASIYAVTFLTATMGQLFLPAALAAVPELVPRSQLLSANSALQVTVTLSQFLGMVILAPLMLKVMGFHASYLVAGLLILATVPLVARLPALRTARPDVAEHWRDRLRAAPAELRGAWEAVRGDRLTLLALLQLSTGAMLLFMFALLVPRFVRDVLDLDADNAVFIFAPTGMGALLALRMLPWLGRRFTPSGIVTGGLFALAAAIIAFGGVSFLVEFLQEQQPFGALGPDQVGGVSLLVFITLLLAFPLGVSYALVNAPAQTVLHERAPEAMRGRLFGAQLMLANAISMLMLLLIGGLADASGVEVALFAVAGMTLALALVSAQLLRKAAAGDGRAL